MPTPWILPATLLVSSLLVGQQDPPRSDRAEYAALVTEYEAAQSQARELRQTIAASEEYRAARAAKDTAKVNELLAAADVDMAHWVARFGHGAEQHRDSDAAVPFLCWIAIHGRDSKDVKEALDILVADHVDSSALLAAVEEPSWTYRTIPPEQSIPILRHIADESPFDVVRAYAYYELARVMKRSKPDDAAAIEEADAMLRKAERFAVGTDLELVIQAPSFEAERLQIGMEVPDIVGEDLERIPFRLSDYRGKVVVLDFWGDW